MSVTLKDVKHIAELARLEFDEKELEAFTSEMNSILEYVEKLDELDTEHVEPLSHPVEMTNTWREDELKKSYPTDEALKNAPYADDKHFHVPKVINTD